MIQYKHIEITEENFEETIENYAYRYGRPPAIYLKHLSNVLSHVFQSGALDLEEMDTLELLSRIFVEKFIVNNIPNEDHIESIIFAHYLVIEKFKKEGLPLPYQNQYESTNKIMH